MNFKMKKLVVYICLPAALLFSGCEDFLDEMPDQRTQLNTPAKVSELLVTAYPRANYITFAEAMSDNVIDNYGNSNIFPINTNPIHQTITGTTATRLLPLLTRRWKLAEWPLIRRNTLHKKERPW